MATLYSMVVPVSWASGVVTGGSYYIQLFDPNTGLSYTSIAPGVPGGIASFSGIPNGRYQVFVSAQRTGPFTAIPGADGWYVIAADATGAVDGVFHSVTVLPSGPYAPNLPGNAAVATPGGVAAGKFWDYGGEKFNIMAAGAKCDAQEITDAVTTASSGVVTSVSGKFKSTDVGKVAAVLGVGSAGIANPTVAITGADGGAGATTLPVGTYTFVYTWAFRIGTVTTGRLHETTAGTSSNTYVQGTANHIIILTIPALPAGAQVTKVYCSIAPAGAFTGEVGDATGTTFTYTTGLTANSAVGAPTVNLTGAPLLTTIASFQSATQVTLAANATLAGTNVNMLWGTDDGAALTTVIAAAVAAGAGEVEFPPPGIGSQGYLMKTGLTINIPLIALSGAYSKIYYTGSGDFFRENMSPFVTNGQPGVVRGLVIDGSYSGDGAVGIHWGDAVQGTWRDVTVQLFNGIGSKGVWLDNRTSWTERLLVDGLWTFANTTNMLFDVNGGTNSFAHCFFFNHKTSVNGGQTGIQLNGNATVTDGVFSLTGNLAPTGTLINITSTAALGFRGGGELFSIGVEGPAIPPGGVTNGIIIAAGASLMGAGVIDLFIGGSTTSSNAGTNNLQFSGWFDVPGLHTMQASESFTTFGDAYLHGALRLLSSDNGGSVFTAASFTFDGATVTLNWPFATAAGQRFISGGKVYPGTDAGAQQTSAGIYGGSGAPNNANGSNGDYYFRSDTPGTVNQRLYVKSAGAWTGII